MDTINKHFISIITPTYNRRNIISRSIDSSLELIKNGWAQELIIIDDASTDKTKEFLEEKYDVFLKKKQIKIIRLNKNLGVTGAKNIGAENSQGEWLIFMDSDDYFLTNCGNLINKELYRLSDYQIVFFRCHNMLDNRLIGHTREASEIKFYEMFTQGTPGECLPIVKREIILKYPYHEKLRGCEGLSYFKIIDSKNRAYISDIVARVYDDTGDDRLCSRKALFARRKKMFMYNILILKYLHRGSFKKSIQTIVRIFYYGFLSLLFFYA